MSNFHYESFPTSKEKYGLPNNLICECCAARQILEESLKYYFNNSYKSTIINDLSNKPFLWGILSNINTNISVKTVETKNCSLESLGHRDKKHQSIYRKREKVQFVPRKLFMDELMSNLPEWFYKCLHSRLKTLRGDTYLKGLDVIELKPDCRSQVGLSNDCKECYICLEATLHFMLQEKEDKPFIESCEHKSCQQISSTFSMQVDSCKRPRGYLSESHHLASDHQSIVASPPKLLQAAEKRHVFVDNSTIFIGANRRGGSTNNAHFDIHKLTALLVANLPGTKFVAGSKPPITSGVWKIWKADGFQVEVTTRGYDCDSEDNVPRVLYNQIMETIATSRRNRDIRGANTLVLATEDVSGSGRWTTFTDCIVEALNSGWRVELWSWKRYFSHDLMNLCIHDNIKMLYFDDEDIDLEFKKPAAALKSFPVAEGK
mmetsp:Transcript_29058/g.39919  ORF Transcript_29058/g.39919 Transcript_29058/m.39919 type:complete len:432 (+) Transcript_29058:1601-2896(+)